MYRKHEFSVVRYALYNIFVTNIKVSSECKYLVYKETGCVCEMALVAFSSNLLA